MTGTWYLIRILGRTARVQLMLWPLALTTILIASTASIASNSNMASIDQRRAYEATAMNAPGISALTGRGYDLSTLGGILTHEMGYLSLIIYPLVGIIIAISLTRGLEASGRLEIVMSKAVSRSAPVAAASTVILAVAILTAGASAGLLMAQGYSVLGSVLYCGSLSALLFVFAMLAILCGQLVSTTRQAYALAISLFVPSYLLRAMVDAREMGVAYWNPESWLAEVRPFSEHPTTWPWLFFLMLSVVSTVVAMVVANRSDIGAGVFPQRSRPATAARWVSSPASLFLTLTKSIVIGWALAAGLFAFVFGYLAQDLFSYSKVFGSDAQQLQSLLVLFVRLNAILSIGVGVYLAQFAATEELSGRMGQVLATRRSRTVVALSTGVLSLVSALVVLVVTGVSTGIGLSISAHDSGSFGDGFRATVEQAPATCLCVAVAVLLAGWRPRLVPLAWIVVGWSLVVSLRGDMMNLDQAARNLSPLEWMGKVPLEAWNLDNVWKTIVLIFVLMSGYLISFNRRDLQAG